MRCKAGAEQLAALTYMLFSTEGVTQNLLLAAPAPQQTGDKAFLDWLNYFKSGPENNFTSMLSKHL